MSVRECWDARFVATLHSLDALIDCSFHIYKIKYGMHMAILTYTSKNHPSMQKPSCQTTKILLTNNNYIFTFPYYISIPNYISIEFKEKIEILHNLRTCKVINIWMVKHEQHRYSYCKNALNCAKKFIRPYATEFKIRIPCLSVPLTFIIFNTRLRGTVQYEFRFLNLALIPQFFLTTPCFAYHSSYLLVGI